MASRGNPNTPSKQRRKASRNKVQRRSAGKVVKNTRGTATSTVLHPTSGPTAPLSGKKARKVEKATRYARRRALEAAMLKDGDVFMTDAPKVSKSKTVNPELDKDRMEVDEIN